MTSLFMGTSMRRIATAATEFRLLFKSYLSPGHHRVWGVISIAKQTGQPTQYRLLIPAETTFLPMDKAEFPVEKLKDFPGFAVQYNPEEYRYFKTNIENALARVSKCELGKNLIKDIGDSTPQITFPGASTIKCIIRPMKVVYDPPGKKLRKAQEGFHPFTGEILAPEDKDKTFVKESQDFPNKRHCDQSARVMALNPKFGDNGGSVCYMTYSNAYFIDNLGNQNIFYIVFAHELIHLWHYCTGTTCKDEEDRTVGIGKYANEKYTENKFRQVFKLETRKEY